MWLSFSVSAAMPSTSLLKYSKEANGEREKRGEMYFWSLSLLMDAGCTDLGAKRDLDKYLAAC